MACQVDCLLNVGIFHFVSQFLLSHTGKKFEPLHERISPDILPKVLGGKLEAHEAVDESMLRVY